MKNTPNRDFLNKRDIIIIGAILLVAAAFFLWNWFNQTQAEHAEARHFADIYMMGVPVRRVFFDQEQTFSLADEAEAYNLLEALVLTMIPEELVEGFMEEVVGRCFCCSFGFPYGGVYGVA